MIKYKNNINVGTGSVGYEADATSAAPLDSVSEGRIMKSEGRTVKWNQLGYTRDSDLSWSGLADIYSIYTYANKHLLLKSKPIKGKFNFGAYTSSIDDYIKNTLTTHRFYGSVEVAVFGNPSQTTLVYLGALNGTRMKTPPGLSNRESFDKTETEIFKKISFVSTVDCDPQYYYMGIGAITGTSSSGKQVGLECKNLKIIDLTSIFGAGNEPSTVEAFESWLSENMVEQDYYAHNAGSLVPVTVKGVKRDVGGTTVTNPMPVTTLKDENDVVMFPDGLKSAGSVKDEIDWEHGVAVKRVGVVDLGDCTWSRSNDNKADVFYIQNIKYPTASNVAINAICCDYVTKTWNSVYSSTSNMEFSSSAVGDERLCFFKQGAFPSGTTPSQIQSMFEGVLLYYELATPVTYHFATHADLKKRVVKIGESVEVDGIEGETVVCNQIIQDGDFNDGSVWQVTASTTFTVSNNKATVSFVTNGRLRQILGVPLISDHKYLLSAFVTPSSKRTIDIEISYGWVKIKKSCEASVRTKVAGIVTAGTTYSYSMFQIYPELNSGESETIIVEYAQCIDLTLMFGSGNEPATVAEFEAWLSAHGGIKDYYPYCAGELKDKEEGNVRGVGFNLWDEEWEGGSINPNTGADITNADKIRSKNYIPVLPSTTYYWLTPIVNDSCHLIFYDKDKNYISFVARPSGYTPISFTTPSNCAYVRFNHLATTYNHDICINLSDPSRNGTYVPYKSITRSVDLTTLKGKVDGAGEDVVIFPDGMKQAGSVKDEMFVEGGVVKAVKRVGTVDLGELEWVYNNGSVGHERFNVVLSDNKMPLSANTAGNIITPKYDNKPFNDVYGHTTDRIIALASTNNILAVYDSAYTSAADFTTAMQGVMLNYELASPVTYVVNMQGMEMAEVRKVMVGTNLIYEK